MAARGKPKGHPKTGGRVKGTPNAVTLEVRELCQQHGPEVIKILMEVARKGETSQARVSACKELLDRGYGRTPQHVNLSGDGGGPVRWLVERNIVEPKARDPDRESLSPAA